MSNKKDSKYEYIRIGFADRETNLSTKEKRISGRVTTTKQPVFEQGDFLNFEPLSDYVNKMVELGFKTPEAGAEELANSKKIIDLKDGTKIEKETLYSVTLVKPKVRKTKSTQPSF